MRIKNFFFRKLAVMLAVTCLFVQLPETAAFAGAAEGGTEAERTVTDGDFLSVSGGDIGESADGTDVQGEPDNGNMDDGGTDDGSDSGILDEPVSYVTEMPMLFVAGVPSYSGSVYGIDWDITDGVLTLSGAADSSPALDTGDGHAPADAVTADNYTTVWPWLAHKDEFSAVIVDCVLPYNSSWMFCGIDVTDFATGTNFDAGNLHDAQNMFRNTHAAELNLSGWHPAALNTIDYMFYNSQVDSLNMSGWDFSHLKNYTYIMDRDMGNTNSTLMFYNAAIKNLDWSYTNWTGQYTIPSIDGRVAGSDTVSHIETVNMSHMTAPQAYHFMTGYINMWHYSHNDFSSALSAGMKSLKSVDLSYSDFSNVTTLNSCFKDASALVSVNFEGINLGAVATTESMFEKCAMLPGVDLSPIPFGGVRTCEKMFLGCTVLDSDQLLGLDTRDYKNVTTMNSMFQDSGITTADFFKGHDLGKVVTFESVFRGCDKLQSCDMSEVDLSSLTSMQYAFCNCKTLPETGVKFGNVTGSGGLQKLNYAFYGCAAMKNFAFLENLDTSACTDWSYAFSYCTGLDSVLDMSAVDMSAMTEARNLFASDTSVEIIDLSGAGATDCSLYCFVIGCSNLKRVKVKSGGWKVKGNTGLSMANLTDAPPQLYSNPMTLMTTDEYTIIDCAATCSGANYYCNGGAFPEGTEVTSFGVQNYITRYVYSVCSDDTLNRTILYEDYPAPIPTKEGSDGQTYSFVGWTGYNGTVSRYSTINNSNGTKYPLMAGDGPSNFGNLNRVARYGLVSTITESVQNGSVECYEDAAYTTRITQAAEGQKVYLKVIPDEGYSGALTGYDASIGMTVYYARLFDADWVNIPDADNYRYFRYDGASYYFTMPAQNVTISGALIPLKYALTVQNVGSVGPGYGQAGYKTAGMTDFATTDTTVAYGTSVTVGTVGAAAGYQVTWEAEASDGSVIPWTGEDTFTMPGAPVTIKYKTEAVYSYVVSLPASISLTAKDGETVLSGTIPVGIRYLIPDSATVTVELDGDTLRLDSANVPGLSLELKSDREKLGWTNGTAGTWVAADGWREGEGAFRLTSPAEPGQWKGAVVVKWSHSG